MATNDFEEAPGPTYAEKVQSFVGDSIAKATDTSPGTVSLRTWLLLAVVGVCCAASSPPTNYIGVIATVALALSSVPRRPSGTRPSGSER